MPAKTLPGALLALLLLANAATAQSVGDIGRIQAETILYKAQAARNEALAKARGERPDQQETADALPVVRGVFGSDKALYATFLYANGSTIDARSGDVLPGNYIVGKLTPTGVTLRKGGRSHVLGFSDLRPFPAAPAMPAPPPASSIPMPPQNQGQGF